jgi:hypothetical protein
MGGQPIDTTCMLFNVAKYMDSTALIGNNPLTTNMKSSTKPNCVRSSFLNLGLLEKKLEMLEGETLTLFLLGS